MKNVILIPVYNPDDKLVYLIEKLICLNMPILIVADGRTSESKGLSLYELAQVMQEYGCQIAYNLDGGGSSTMYFNERVINNPTSGRGKVERSVSDIFYIGY